MKIKLILSVLCVLAYINTNAQNVVKGYILDSQTKEAVPFCNVMLYSDTSQNAVLLGGGVSDDNGNYSIDYNKNAKYITFSFIGYKTISLSIEANSKRVKDTLYINNILLEADRQTLSTIEVFAQQKRFEMTNDGVAMNIDEDVSSATANAFELLRKVPGVVIDKDENIQLNGKSGILFQINGRDIRIPYSAIKSMLKAMSPSDIEKIETISNPSAKYEAEGTAGIINLRMAKHESLGWSGEVNAWSAYANEWKHNEGLNLNYVNSRWTVNSSLSYNKWAGQTEAESEVYIFNDNAPTTMRKMDKTTQRFDYKGFNGNLSADYKINDNSSIGGMFSFNGSSHPDMDNPATKTRFYTYPYSIVDSSYMNKGDEYGNGRNMLANLWYTRKIDSLGGQYSITLDYNNNISKDYCLDKAAYYYGDFISLMKEGSDNDSTKNTYNTYSAKFDLIKPFNQRMSLEFGAKTRLTKVSNDFICYEDGEYNTETSNHLDYTENVNALYASFSDRLSDKLSLRLGLRAEHTHTNIKQQVNNSEKTKDYIDIFPNLNLSYKLNDMDNLTFVYSYRITRPEYNSMNPFVEKENEYLYKSGNPDLKPQYTHSLNLSYAFHYFIFLTATYDYTNDIISQTQYLRPGTAIFEDKPYNLGHSQQASIGLSTYLPLGKHLEWTIWAQGTYRQTRVDDPLLKLNVERFGFMTWQSIKMDFFFKTKLMLSAFYMTGGQEGTYSMGDMLSFDVNLSKEFLNKSLKASIGVGQLPKRTFTMDMTTENSKIKNSIVWQYPMVSASLSYSFGKKADNNTLKRIQSKDMDERAGGEISTGQGQSNH
ncbi:MAG: TonB-dependent receptor [Bacteroidota bacterium]|nr:TonB-dependent receptor [Bacteroidota bacterium]